MQKYNFLKGQSLFELVVAVAISGLIIVAIVSLVTNSIRNATFSRNNAQATSYAQQAVEWLRSERDRSIITFLANTATPVWCFDTVPPVWATPGGCTSNQTIDETIFIREATFSSSTTLTGDTLIHVSVSVEWTDSQGVHVVTNSTDFTDWRQR